LLQGFDHRSYVDLKGRCSFSAPRVGISHEDNFLFSFTYHISVDWIGRQILKVGFQTMEEPFTFRWQQVFHPSVNFNSIYSRHKSDQITSASLEICST